jgi:hypothetical protein
MAEQQQQQQVPVTGEQLQQVHNDGALIDFLSSLLDYTPTGFRVSEPLWICIIGRFQMSLLSIT